MTFTETFVGTPIGSLTIGQIADFVVKHPEENLHLEFKSGLFFSSDKRDEITKVVTSFANSDGGLLIIGVKEKKESGAFHADSIDGVPIDQKHSKEALENIIVSNISPKIDMIQIARVESGGRSVFILEIPKSERAPHMASDYRYYKRLNFQKVPMEHYEVEDFSFGRRKTPVLTAKLSFSNSKLDGNNFSFSMRILLRNKGRIVAKHVLLIITIRFLRVGATPGGFQILKQDQNETVLQYGPFTNGIAPVLITPSPSESEVWTSIGELQLVRSNSGSVGLVSYQINHEELPMTTGFLALNTPFPQELLNSGSVEVISPNEKVSY